MQTEPGGIGPALDAIHQALDGWLGKPGWKQSAGRVTLSYRFDSEDLPPARLKLKVEINSREHFNVYGVKDHRFEVSSRWFTGAADLRTYELDQSPCIHCLAFESSTGSTTTRPPSTRSACRRAIEQSSRGAGASRGSLRGLLFDDRARNERRKLVQQLE